LPNRSKIWSWSDEVQERRLGPLCPKGQFAGEVIGFSDDEYIIRDPEKLKWLRAEGELSFAKPAKKEAA